MVHIVPQNWNWYPGMEIPVWVYTNCESVELFLNGKSQGTLRHEEFDQVSLKWDIMWEPGELLAIAKNNEHEIVRTTVSTTGWPQHINLQLDRSEIDIDRDLAYITVATHDQKDQIVPIADNLITFTLLGPGKIIGVDNGNPLSHEPFVDEERHLFMGFCLVIVESIGKEGDIVLKASSPHIESASVTIHVKKNLLLTHMPKL
jgi:beta-galactosidase